MNKNNKNKSNNVNSKNTHSNKDDLCKEENNFQKKHLRHQTITSWISVAITALGLIFIIAELNEINTQNKLIGEQNNSLRKSITQTYRPLGMARFAWEEDTIKIKTNLEIKSGKATFGFEYFLTFKNYGKGILRYLGAIITISLTPIELRNSIIENNEKLKLNTDKLKVGERGNILLPNGNDKQILRFYFAELPLVETYYCNVIFFYRDQEENLYDTEHVSLLKIDPKKIFSKNEKSNIKNIRIHKNYMIEKFHNYTIEEEDKLVKSLNYYGPEFSNILK